jgi:hypothetical protein
MARRRRKVPGLLIAPALFAVVGGAVLTANASASTSTAGAPAAFAATPALAGTAAAAAPSSGAQTSAAAGRRAAAAAPDVGPNVLVLDPSMAVSGSQQRLTRNSALGSSRADPTVVADSACQVPDAPGVRFHDLVTVPLGGDGAISHVINTTGDPVNSTNTGSTYLVSHP